MICACAISKLVLSMFHLKNLLFERGGLIVGQVKARGSKLLKESSHCLITSIINNWISEIPSTYPTHDPACPVYIRVTKNGTLLNRREEGRNELF